MNPALLIIDMQKDFVLPGAPLRVEGALATVPAIRRLLEKARAEGWPVFHVVREHRPDGSDAEMFRRHLFENGGAGFCVAGREGSAIVDELAPLPGEHKIVKTRFSAFYRTSLEDDLRALGVDTVLLSGTQYPNCVRGTAVDALYRDLHGRCRARRLFGRHAGSGGVQSAGYAQYGDDLRVSGRTGRHAFIHCGVICPACANGWNMRLPCCPHLLLFRGHPRLLRAGRRRCCCVMRSA